MSRKDISVQFKILLSAVILLPLSLNAGSASLTDDGIKGIGSTMAYLALCEMRELLPVGNLADLTYAAQTGLTPETWEKVKSQYQRSLSEKKQYWVSEKRWVPFRLKKANCESLNTATPLLVSNLEKGR